jgi:hypothetical protein
MRYRLMATYRGVPYEVGLGPSNFELVLFAACPPPEELGFEPATGHWRKQVIRAEIDALWESRPVGTFRGEPCIVLDDPGDGAYRLSRYRPRPGRQPRLLAGGPGGLRTARAARRGYWAHRGAHGQATALGRAGRRDRADGDLPVRQGTLAGRGATGTRTAVCARGCCPGASCPGGQHRGGRCRARRPSAD